MGGWVGKILRDKLLMILGGWVGIDKNEGGVGNWMDAY